jgi:hypothetical protein
VEQQQIVSLKNKRSLLSKMIFLATTTTPSLFGANTTTTSTLNSSLFGNKPAITTAPTLVCKKEKNFP